MRALSTFLGLAFLLLLELCTANGQGALWVRKMRTVFARLDSNHDNRLTRKDFLALGVHIIRCCKLDSMQRMNQIMMMESDAWDKFFAGPGTPRSVQERGISERQFVDAMRREMQSPETSKNLRNMYHFVFGYMDHDQDGMLTFTEYADMPRCSGVPDAFIQANFDTLDTDADGVIQEAEFIEAAKQYYTTNDESNRYNHVLYGPLVN
ncbi:sarcoplasmic calcium-binding protein [Lingula anatina]|uniref:Sarcoplasmic calcium-binding protein n=1 Tax=Lingula anatina TaxID=7574 RepID=A0A1S3JSG2_LINAN|nr:sarcoplasmic calcium-binding protein [Lingula anatina]|eukprot:XP_013413303.1 sarcoplasmic calcium-binding protein [Lingula anatina]